MTAIETSERRIARPAHQFCRSLGEESEASAVGGKAFALGRMVRAGMPVPSGFVILADALELHLAQNGIAERVVKLCAEIDASDTTALTRTSTAVGRW